MPRPSTKRNLNTPVVVQQPEIKSPTTPRNDMVFWIFLGCLVLAGALFFRGGNGSFFHRESNPDGQVSPAFRVDLKQAYLVRVYETADMPSWLVVNVRDDTLWKDFVADKFGSIDKLLTFDPKQGGVSNPDAEPYVKAAAKRGINPPFWLIAKDSGGEVVHVGSISESENSESIKKKIMQAAK